MNKAQEIRNRFLAGCEKQFKKTYEFLKGKRVWIYGSGMYGRFLAKALVHYGCVEQEDIQAFINDFESGFEVDGIPVAKLDNCTLPPVSGGHDGYCVVLGMENNGAVVERLKTKGISHFADTKTGLLSVEVPLMFQFGRYNGLGFVTEARIERFLSLNLPEEEMASFYEDEESLTVLKNRLELRKTGRCELLTSCPITQPEYFKTGLLAIGQNEVYVDCGAFTGDTVVDFVAFTGGHYKKIHAFEPDPSSFENLRKNSVNLPNVELHNVATGNQDGQIFFETGQGVSSTIVSAGETRVRVVRLDDYLEDVPTFVKMDIEGAELESLYGMTRILREYRPKLAISAYHKVEDLYTIPKYIRKIVPEYRLKLRQHSPGLFDTVLYAEV